MGITCSHSLHSTAHHLLECGDVDRTPIPELTLVIPPCGPQTAVLLDHHGVPITCAATFTVTITVAVIGTITVAVTVTITGTATVTVMIAVRVKVQFTYAARVTVIITITGTATVTVRLRVRVSTCNDYIHVTVKDLRQFVPVGVCNRVAEKETKELRNRQDGGK